MNDSWSDRDPREMVEREHAELRELLSVINQIFAERLKTVTSVAEMMASLCEKVERHFDAEESADLFQQIASRAPRLAQDSEMLEHEHVELRDILRSLADQVREGSGSEDWWNRTEEQFVHFRKRLGQHEGKENALLMRAYDEDIGAND